MTLIQKKQSVLALSFVILCLTSSFNCSPVEHEESHNFEQFIPKDLINDGDVIDIEGAEDTDIFQQLLNSQKAATFNTTNMGRYENEDVYEHLDKRVINGEKAPPHTFRWAVSIKGVYPKTKATTYCGASIITSQWLVTAAHCFIGDTKNGDTMRNPKYWHIQAGNVNIELGSRHSENQKLVGPNGLQNYPPSAAGGSKIMDLINALITGQSLTNMVSNKNEKYGPIIHAHPDKIVVHPKYKKTDLEWDIALIHLKFPLPLADLPDVAKIHLPSKTDPKSMPTPGEVCVLIGWGCRYKGGGPSKRAQMARLKVIKNSKCSHMYSHNAGLNKDHEFCAGYYKGNIGICPGDSGSGLSCQHDGKWYVAGVASATHAKKPGSFPGLFTRISYFRDWIDHVTNNGVNK